MQPSLNEDTIEEAIYTEDPKKKPNFFAETKSLFQSYLNERIALVKLQAAEKISVTAAAVITGVVLFVLAIFLLIFVSITLGFAFSYWFDSRIAGFGTVAGIYLLLMLLVVFFGKNLFGNAITQKLIQSFFKKK